MFDNKRLETYATKDDYTGEARPRVVISIADEDIARDVADYFKTKAIDALEDTSRRNNEKEAEEFYKAASPYKPTYYWLDVEEKTMKDMNAGVEAFRAKLQALGAKNIGLYIGTYFMEEHSISTDKFTALWIPTYGFDDGYYNAAPDTNTEYDLHQYTSQGQLNGFSHYLDLNQIAPTQDQEAIYRKLFKVQKDNSSS